MKKFFNALVKINLHWQILISFILAIFFVLFFPQFVKYIDWLGDLFMRALKMIVVPLIITSMVSGIVNLSSEHKIGKLSVGAIAYNFITTLVAVLLGYFCKYFSTGIGL
jgi:Na+/H+-dicarboxylate symporter